ncbi:MAG: hypothetical protein QNK24_02405 [Desulfuromusa sp.]|nr:hypothetical protein [Desulfuromusa sp.]
MKRIMGVLLIMLLALAGCSTKTKVESDLGIKGAPDWVNEGTQILNDKGGRYFHGVGQAPPMGDDSLQISTADNRARAEVARILTSFMDVVQNDYSTAAGTTAELVSEQSISRQIESLTKTNISGVEIIGHWRDKKTGKVYSIAELDLEQVKKVIAANEEMNSGLGKYFDSHGANIFDLKEGPK